MRTKLLMAAMLLGTCSTVASAQEASEWALHGFADVSVKNDYITPRGLVVTTHGATVQALDGLVLVAPDGITFHAGTWVDINPGFSRTDGNITAVNEFDYFVGVDKDIVPKVNIGVEYSEFISGQSSVAFQNEHNIEFHVKYKDGSATNPFTFNPYAKLFWAFASKSSTVVTGKHGKTFDVEIGAAPTYAGKGFTLSVPTWITVGPKTYWGLGKRADGNVGVISTGLKVSTPLSFIKNGGGASVYLSAQYFHLVNDNLVRAEAILNPGQTKRDKIVFGGGISYGF